MRTRARGRSGWLDAVRGVDGHAHARAGTVWLARCGTGRRRACARAHGTVSMRILHRGTASLRTPTRPQGYRPKRAGEQLAQGRARLSRFWRGAARLSRFWQKGSAHAAVLTEKQRTCGCFGAALPKPAQVRSAGGGPAGPSARRFAKGRFRVLLLERGQPPQPGAERTCGGFDGKAAHVRVFWRSAAETGSSAPPRQFINTS